MWIHDSQGMAAESITAGLPSHLRPNAFEYLLHQVRIIAQFLDGRLSPLTNLPTLE